MRGAPLVVVLGGTGIAAGRPLLERRIADGDAERTRVYVGVRSADHLPMHTDLVKWMRAGAGLLVCLSGEDGHVEEIPCALGHVHDLLRGRNAAYRWSGEHVFAVGPPSMIEALRELAREMGISPQRIHTNY
jgi:NAD(P)H-flavin reductase